MSDRQAAEAALAAWFTARADAIRDVAAHRASPPEYPGMALVPVPDLDRLAVYVELPKSRAALPVPSLDALRAKIEKLLPDTEYQIETMDGHLRPMQTPADGWECCQSQVLAALREGREP